MTHDPEYLALLAEIHEGDRRMKQIYEELTANSRALSEAYGVFAKPSYNDFVLVSARDDGRLYLRDTPLPTDAEMHALIKEGQELKRRIPKAREELHRIEARKAER